MARTITAAAAGSTRNRGVLLLAALFGVLSAGLMFAFLNNRGDGGTDIEKAINSGGETETVVVLAKDVAAGEKITTEHLTTRPVPASALLPGRVTDAKDIVGKVATAPMFIGEQAIAAKVTTYEGQVTLAYKVPEGMRALSLQVPHEAWAGGGVVQPGDRVDVFGITTLMKVDPLTGEEKPVVLSGIIAQDVEVLAVAQSVVKKIPNIDAAKAKGAEENETEPSGGALDGAGTVAESSIVAPIAGEEAPTFPEALSITLALTPEQAAKISMIDALKDDVAQYRITARRKGDAELVTGTQTWNLEDVFITTSR